MAMFANSWQQNEGQNSLCFGGRVSDLWKECVESLIVNTHSFFWRVPRNSLFGHDNNGASPGTDTLFNHASLFQLGQLFSQPVNMAQGDAVRGLRNWRRVSCVNVHFNQACVTNIKVIGRKDVSILSTQLFELFQLCWGTCAISQWQSFALGGMFRGCHHRGPIGIRRKVNVCTNSDALSGDHCFTCGFSRNVEDMVSI